MVKVVKVTRRGQTTIPLEIRKQLNIKEGDELMVEISNGGVLFRKIPKLEELAGVDSPYGNVDEVKREIDAIREEY